MIKIILFASTVTMLSFNFNIDKPVKVTEKVDCTYGDYYAVTGYTDNEYGQNYSIPLRICGSRGYGGVSINFVEANTGYGWSRVSHTSDFRQRNRYYVTVGGNTYYFSI